MKGINSIQIFLSLLILIGCTFNPESAIEILLQSKTAAFLNSGILKGTFSSTFLQFRNPGLLRFSTSLRIPITESGFNKPVLIKNKQECKPYFEFDTVEHFYFNIEEAKIVELERKSKRTYLEDFGLNPKSAIEILFQPKTAAFLNSGLLKGTSSSIFLQSRNPGLLRFSTS